MITIACSACQKKLSVRDDLAGKTIKCPACGAMIACPAAAPVTPGAQRSADLPTVPPSPPDASDAPTNPPSERPDVTMSVKAPEPTHDASLTDFLAPPQADDELGRLGNYRILQILGHGGMGVVYKAEDVRLKRLVAIKAMLPTLAASASSGKRFLHEAEAMAAVEHDHIVRIYQIDEERGVPFMAMEFLRGEPLDECLKRDEKLPVAEAVRIGREIAEGLAAAHARGLIHRDIKPANIWLEASPGRKSGEPRVKLLDFGLARAASRESGLTQQGAIIGTPSYMAPEQARGDTLDSRCDLFSLGVVLYRLCTGQLPFRGSDMVSTLMEVATHAPRPPFAINSQLPRPLSELVMKLLEKDAAKRPGSATDVVHVLGKIEQALKRERSAPQLVPVARAKTVTLPPKRPPRLAKTQTLPAAGRATVRRRSVAVVAVALFAAFGCLIVLVAGPIVYWLNDSKQQIVQDGKGIGEKEVQKVEPVVVPVAAPSRPALQFGDADRIEAVAFKDPGGPLTIEGFVTVLEKGVKRSGWVMAVGPGASGKLSAGSVVLRVVPDGSFTLNLIGEKGADSKGIKAPGQLGQRVHVACIRTDKELRLFVNGKLAGSEPHAFMPAKGRLMFGGGSFHGIIDEVRVSKSARYETDFASPTRLVKDADTAVLYHFGEGAGDTVKDVSGHGHSGKIIGAKWVTVEGPAAAPPAGPDYALKFDGKTSHVELPTLFRSDNGPITVEGYVTPKSVGPLSYIVRLGGPFPMSLHQQGGAWHAHILVGDADTERSGPMFSAQSGAGTISVGKRVHLALVYDGKESALFVDGKRHAGVGGVSTSNPKTPSMIGARRAGNGSIRENFAGIIDEVRISKIARYVTDFTPAPRFESDKDTIALYHFDEGTGNFLKDTSGQNYHGKIVGATWANADGTPLAAAAKPEPFTALFNGKDLAGWTVIGHPGWSAKDGVLVGESAKARGWLMSDKEYADFELSLEYKQSAGGNSGVFLRAWPEGPVDGGKFMEIQLIDDAKVNDSKHRTGALYAVAAPDPLPKATVNQWHRLLIRAQGTQVQVTFDDQKILSANLDDHADRFVAIPGLTKTTGRIGLQLYPGRIEFKNIRVRPLGPG